MDSQLHKILAECIADIERGADIDDCLRRHSGRASELRPHLEAWTSLSGLVIAHPPVAAFDRGRAAMLGALRAPIASGPLAAARLAAWAPVAGAAAAVVILLGGAAGASAALGGPDVPGDVLDAVGVSSDNADSGIGHSSASDRGLQCANPNAFEGKGNSEDGSQNAADAHEKQPCEESSEEQTDTALSSEEGCEDANRGHGNDADHDDADNPGQGEGNHGAEGEDTTAECPPAEDSEDENKGHGNDADHDDDDNPGQGQGNHGTGNNGNAGENADDNGNAGNAPDDANPQGDADGGEPQGQANGQDKD